MADTPLLLPPHDSGAAGVISIDDAADTNSVAAVGDDHLLPAALAAFAWVFDAQQTFISVFADAMPPWGCTSPSCSTFVAGAGASTASSPCNLPAGSWSWSLPTHSSTVSEWSIECAPPALLGLPSSSYFAGCLAGGFLLATLADTRLGRKNMLVLSSLVMSLSAAATALSPSLLVYSALRFVCGFGRATVGTSALVLSTELVGRRWRDRISILSFLCFTLGFLSLPAIAYAGRGASWRTLYLSTSLPSFLYTVVIFFFMKESPRWLLVSGGGAAAGDIFSAARTLWENRWAFRRLAATMTVSFGVGMVYYGMPLNLGNLSSDLYLSVVINAVAELPSSLLVFFLLSIMNRRSSTLAFTAAGGVLSLACAAMAAGGGGGWPETAAEVAAFFSACTAFSIVLIYSIELFPTCVRNSAIAMVRQALVAGGVVAPAVVALGRRRRFVSFGVFGLAILCCGLFAVCLPETRGSGISDTMEEEEFKEISPENTRRRLID